MSAPVLRFETRTPRLAGHAFGAQPPRSAAELPEPGSAVEIWWQAVALGGTGHYAAARAALCRLRANTTDPVLLSLAASTEGSLRRQLGGHARAAHDDGRAAALVLPRLPRDAGSGDRPDPAHHHSADLLGTGTRPLSPEPFDTEPTDYYRTPDPLDAAADALIGLAADALGTGRLALATRLLDRCSALLGIEYPPLPAIERPAGADHGTVQKPARAAVDRSRAFVRLHWVRAETALAGGRSAEALTAAETALAAAERGPSIRHRVKSRLLVAAAAGVTGDTGRAAELAALVDAQCHESGLLPLRWACAMLRTGLPAPGARPGATHAAVADAAACRALIAARGGRFRDSAR